MSIHTSLRRSGAMKRARSVLSRVERLEALKSAAKWKEGDSVFGLPKVRTVFKVKGVKKKKKDEE
ncbi:MAG: small basic protein [Planctomycetota bacterium]